ncbi:MAG: hypothetical protein WDZ26_04820 [Nitriliruptoraceae bacterium]
MSEARPSASGAAARGGEPSDDATEAPAAPPAAEDPPSTSTTQDAPSPGTTDLNPVMPHRPPRPPRRTGVFVDTEDLREHVGDLLRAILGGYEVDAFGNFTFTHEGARVFVTVGPSPVGPQVGIFSVTNLDLDLEVALATFLLTTNHALGFGAFSYDRANRAVWLRHTLLGTTLDLPELHAAVAAIASTAASLDETIRDQFGGRTFQEAPDDVQRRMEPPETSSGPLPNASGYL